MLLNNYLNKKQKQNHKLLGVVESLLDLQVMKKKSFKKAVRL